MRQNRFEAKDRYESKDGQTSGVVISYSSATDHYFGIHNGGLMFWRMSRVDFEADHRVWVSDGVVQLDYDLVYDPRDEG